MWTQLNLSTENRTTDLNPSTENRATDPHRSTDEPAARKQHETSSPKPFEPYDPGPILRRRASFSDRATKVVLIAATLIAIWYVTTSVTKYLTVTRDTYGLFWPRHEWLFMHALAGTIAVVFGPVQFWMGLKRDQPMLHRAIGIAYVLCVAIGGISAIYLATHTVYGWIFGAGLTGMAITWLLTTAVATMAIIRRRVSLHREWVARSYVITFGFVLFRLIVDGLEMGNVGTMPERLAFSSWAAWTIPLILLEGISQARKVFAKPNANLNEA